MALSTIIPTKVSSTETKLKLEAYLQQVRERDIVTCIMFSCTCTCTLYVQLETGVISAAMIERIEQEIELKFLLLILFSVITFLPLLSLSSCTCCSLFMYMYSMYITYMYITYMYRCSTCLLRSTKTWKERPGRPRLAQNIILPCCLCFVVCMALLLSAFLLCLSLTRIYVLSLSHSALTRFSCAQVHTCTCI